MLNLWKDFKLGINLLRREGFRKFFNRGFRYLLGARLKEDFIFKKNFAKKSWMIESKKIPKLKNFPTISIIIPVFNHEKFVEQAISSVQNQNYPQEKIEIIVVDDGSSDNSFAVAKKILQKNTTKFQIYKQKNSGAHAAINFGLNKSTSEFLGVLNSDDFFHPDRIKFLVSALKNSKSEFAFSGVEFVDEKGKITNNKNLAANFEKKQNYVCKFPTAGFAILDGNIAISTGNFIFTKNLFQKIGDFKNLKCCHDWDFILRSLEFCEPIFVLQKLYFYRFHSHNSFLGLQNILAIEHKKLLSDFFKIKNSQNPNFPNAKNFPNYFPKFIKNSGYKKYNPILNKNF